jgi:hypothetical protein
MVDCELIMEDEIWKSILDCPNFMVSNLGRVRGFDTKRKVWSIRGQSKGSHGYLMVNLKYDSGKRGSECVHSLVCRVFNGPRRPGSDCCHNDGNKHNNRADNLRWDSRRNNINDQKIHGTFAWRGKRKLSENDATEIVKRIDAGEGVTELSKEYGVRHGVISGINLGKYWAEVTGRKREDACINPRRGHRVRGILTDEAVIDIARRLDAGEKQRSIADIYKIKPQTVSEINLGKIWSWLTKRGNSQVTYEN